MSAFVLINLVESGVQVIVSAVEQIRNDEDSILVHRKKIEDSDAEDSDVVLENKTPSTEVGTQDVSGALNELQARSPNQLEALPALNVDSDSDVPE